jgi:hypothetical protein
MSQIDAWDRGYYTCLAKENAGTLLAPLYTHAASEILTHAAEQNASKIAGAAYHVTDGRFTAWGKYSKVLVPEAANGIKTVAKGVNAAGWLYFDAELAHSIYECSELL